MTELSEIIKSATVRGLVIDGLIDAEKAEEWCLTHTIIESKRTVFRTFTDKFKKYKEAGDGRVYYICVSTQGVPLLDGEKEKAPVLSIVEGKGDD